jgi:hypothetical protein
MLRPRIFFACRTKVFPALVGARPISPINLASHIPHFIQFRADLHHRVSDHARVQTKCPLDSVLCLRARIEAHDEVVAIVVGCALLARGFREEESAPVCDAADDAACGEDLVACCASDSGGFMLGRCEGGVVCVGERTL